MTQDQSSKADTFLTPNQAAVILNVSLATLKKFIYQGKIKTLKTPGGHHRILKRDLLTMINQGGAAFDITAELARQDSPDIVERLLADLRERRKLSRGHESAVAAVSLEIGRRLGLSAQQQEHLRTAALLHDIGFLGIHDAILNKAQPLSQMDHFVIKTHPLIGEEILKAVARLRNLSAIIRQHHHERYDGAGYPDGLAGQAICPEARIIALAEAFDAMTAEDSYQRPLSRAEALARIEREAGGQFDPEMVRGLRAIRGGELDAAQLNIPKGPSCWRGAAGIFFLFSADSGASVFEGLTIRPRGELRQAYDDNITLANDNEKDDFVTTLLAGLDVGYEGKTQTLTLSGDIKQQLYAREAGFNNLSEALRLNFNQEFSRYDRLRVTDSFTHADEPTSFEDDFGRTAGRYSYYRNTFNTEYTRDISRQISVQGHYGNESYNASRGRRQGLDAAPGGRGCELY